MDGRLTITTSENEIYFHTICDYVCTKQRTAQIKFVYESDFRKYNIVIGLNLDKLALHVVSFADNEQSESIFKVLTLVHGIRTTNIEFEYFTFDFTSEDFFVDYGSDFANISLKCKYSTITQNPHPTIMQISVKIPKKIEE